MKKIGLIALALVLALGVMGGALAYWNETLTISGTVATGELDVAFSNQASNDAGEPGPTDTPPYSGTLGKKDPKCCGVWDFTPLPDNPPIWDKDDAVGRQLLNVGAINCELTRVGGVEDSEVGDNGKNLLTITMTNVYPSYCGNIAFTIDNIGSIPAKIKSITLVSISKGTTVIPCDGGVALVACTTQYIDVEGTDLVHETPDVNGVDTDDFSIHISELRVGGDDEGQIPVGGYIPGDICIHVEEGAEEAPTTYDFTIKIVVSQFNNND